MRFFLQEITRVSQVSWLYYQVLARTVSLWLFLVNSNVSPQAITVTGY